MDLLEFSQGKRLPLKQVQIIGKQIGSALKMMHEKRVIHRDVKLANILIYEKEKVKLIDFDFARYLDNGRANTRCGTRHYCAPEVIIEGPDGYGVKADAYSFGIVLYKLIYGSLPSFTYSMENIVKFADSGKTIEEKARLGGDSAYVDVLNELICHEDKRKTVAEVLKMPFFQQADEEPFSKQALEEPFFKPPLNKPSFKQAPKDSVFQSSILKFLSRFCFGSKLASY